MGKSVGYQPEKSVDVSKPPTGGSAIQKAVEKQFTADPRLICRMAGNIAAGVEQAMATRFPGQIPTAEDIATRAVRVAYVICKNVEGDFNG